MNRVGELPELRPFPKGFIVTQDEAETAPSWFNKLELGSSWIIRHDPALEIESRYNPHFTVTLIGVAYSKTRALDSVQEVLGCVERALSFEFSSKSLTDIAHDLGGRFLIVVSAPERLLAVGDPLGSLATWWGCKTTFALSNYSRLVADYFQDFSFSQKKEFFSHEAYKSNQPWLSNIVPEYDVVLPVLPNHLLTFDGGEIGHERFYPTGPLQQLPVDVAAEIVYDELNYSIERLTLGGPLYFSITSGDDAFAFVDIAAERLRSSNSIGVTYVFLNREANPTHNDLIGANKRMVAAGLPHKIVPMEFEWGSEFAAVYNETHPTMAIFPTLAKSMRDASELDTYFLTGHGGEIGNVFYKERVKGFPTPTDLAEKNGTREFAESELGQSSISDFIEYGQFYEERFFNYDPYDLFYWENRLGRWGARMMGEWDFGARPVSPFASRRLLDAMMSVSHDERVGRAIYQRMHEVYGQIRSGEQRH